MNNDTVIAIFSALIWTFLIALAWNSLARIVRRRMWLHRIFGTLLAAAGLGRRR